MQLCSHQIGGPPCISNLKATQACTSILSEKCTTPCSLPRSAPMPPGERQKQLFLALYVHRNESFPLHPVELVPQFNIIFLEKLCLHYRAVEADGLPGIPLWPRQRCHCVSEHWNYTKFWCENFHIKKALMFCDGQANF